MARKRITQLFPWLLPLRKRQRRLFFYAAMRWDGRRYAACQQGQPLSHFLCEEHSALYNPGTGFDMVYQRNKVFNLGLAVATLQGLLIRPGETFPFWQRVRHADRETPYKEGLVVVNGQLQTIVGGGVCQISNLLFHLFLRTPLTLVERHCHGAKDFPDPPGDVLTGVDATVSEGWLDLKVTNETPVTYQLQLDVGQEQITGRILADAPPAYRYQLANRGLAYIRRGDTVWEEVDVLQQAYSTASGQLACTRFLYHNACPVGYTLPPETPIIDEKERPS